MKKKKQSKNNASFGILLVIVSFFAFLFLGVRLYNLSTSTVLDGINIKEFASKRTTKTEILPAKRGNIYDVHGNTLAENVYSYTLIAYLDPTRTTNENNPQHVVDKENTAKKLSEVIDASYDYILEQLNKEGKYQVEFGKAGQGLDEITKNKINSLNLPGISFIQSQKRYYPNGNFLSYSIGYAKSSSDGKIVGEMGIEKQYDDVLSGTDGFVTYQKDKNGYRILNTDEIREEAKNGYDVYLTIDNSIQLFVEQAINQVAKEYSFESVNVMVADAKTGAILASASNPSFDPNTRENIVSYLDPNISVGVEPGSTMKLFTYMATMEAGKYKGDDTYLSGIYKAKDGTEIGDWNRNGWGYITYDYGFALSSNVGVANLVTKYINRQVLGNYYRKLGFGSPTDIGLPNEASGKLNFVWETEIVNASFGQGILTTPIQNIKALSSVSNDGILLQPYIVDKIVDKDSGKIIYQGEKTELGRVASIDTVKKAKSLMKDVVSFGTGSVYGIEGYDIIAKTGTAQIANPNGGGYLIGDTNVIRGFAGVYPGDDPKIIIYATMTKLSIPSAEPLAKIVDTIIVNATKYYNINTNNKVEVVDKVINGVMPPIISSSVDNAKKVLNKMGINPIVIGDGDTVINVNPYINSNINNKEKVFIITNGINYKMPNLSGWSYKDVNRFCTITGIKCNLNGNGYLVSQSIAEGSLLNNDSVLEASFELKFKE